MSSQFKLTSTKLLILAVGSFYMLKLFDLQNEAMSALGLEKSSLCKEEAGLIPVGETG